MSKFKSVMRKFKSSATALCRDTAGNFALTLGLAAIPLFGAVGFAIDYSRVQNSMSDYQLAADAAAFAAVRYLQENDIDATKVFARQFFDANLGKDAFSNIEFFELKDNATSLTLNVHGKVDTTILKVINKDHFDFGVEARVQIRSKPVEVVLVLDTTDSMNDDGKLDGLKTAAKKFVGKLKPFSTANVKIGIVPFSNYVNVGLSNRGESWIDVPDDYTDSGTWERKIDGSGTNCTTQSVETFADGVSQGFSDKEVCDNYQYETVPYTNEIKWYGCVGSRNAPDNTNDANYNTPVKGIMLKDYQAYRCPSELLPLTDTKAVVDAKIDSLNATGDTYIPSGLLWGWRVMTAQEPFTGGATQAQIDNSEVERIIVLMTDGQSTLAKNNDDWDKPFEHGCCGSETAEKIAEARAKADAVMQQICTNIKATQTQVYAVAFGSSIDTTTESELQTCSNNPVTHYFRATDNDALKTAFADIAGKITQMYLSK